VWDTLVGVSLSVIKGALVELEMGREEERYRGERRVSVYEEAPDFKASALAPVKKGRVEAPAAHPLRHHPG